MVDIEVGRAMVYFSVENKAKMGAGGLGVVKYSFGPKRRRFSLSKAAVLAFLGPKQRHFNHHKFFF